MQDKKEHSFVHDIKIASPCTMSWEGMSGDERQRHCAACKLNVYNISEMTIAEAEALIVEKEGRVCVRLFRRHDGTVLTKDCPKGLAAVRARMQKSIAAVTAVVAVVAAWALNYRANSWDAPLWQKLINAGQTGQHTTGEMAMPARTLGRAIMGDVSMGKMAPSRQFQVQQEPSAFHASPTRGTRPRVWGAATAPTKTVTDIEFVPQVSPKR